MQNLITTGNTLTMSSREIADLVGSRTSSVNLSISRLLARGVIDVESTVFAKPEMRGGSITLGRAAKAYGIHRSSLYEAVERGRVPVRLNAKGQKEVSLADMDEVYGSPDTVAPLVRGVGHGAVSEYMLSKRNSLVVVAQLCPEFTARIVDRWQELEAQAGSPRELSRMDLIQLAFEAEKARLQLTVQVEEQASKIAHMENLFHEGMTIPQFCKGLNGVNVMQVCSFLESRNWLFNESKHSTRWRAASYARDRYLTEHQATITPHGSEPFTAFTPVLLKKGAIRLYDMYLNSELPMKKTWDGLFTHDKALRGAA